MPTKRQGREKAKQRVQVTTTLLDGEVAGYVRVSTEEQKESGLGIGAQEELIRAHCLLRDWPMPVFYRDDGVSGTIDPLAREQMRLLINDIKSGKIKVLMIKSLDRTGRTIDSISYMLKLVQSSGITFFAINEQFDTSTATGRLCMHMMMILAEFERDNTSERTIAALDEKYKKDGDAGGRLPYGYKRVFDKIETSKGVFKKTIDIGIDEERADVVRLIFSLRYPVKGKRKTLEQICTHVRKIMPLGSRGGKWTPTRIKDILEHEKDYRGGHRGDSPLLWPIIIETKEQ